MRQEYWKFKEKPGNVCLYCNDYSLLPRKRFSIELPRISDYFFRNFLNWVNGSIEFTEHITCCRFIFITLRNNTKVFYFLDGYYVVFKMRSIICMYSFLPIDSTFSQWDVRTLLRSLPVRPTQKSPTHLKLTTTTTEFFNGQTASNCF